MKTLIFNGSPRPKGDTASLLKLLTGQLDGKIRQVNAYDGSIHPCVDCRYCWAHPGCAIQDGMQEVYRWIIGADNIVIASPIYFSELTGPLLGVLSRLQSLYCARAFRGESPVSLGKQGLILLVGGGDGSIKRAEASAQTLLRQMGATILLPTISFHDTNRRPALEDLETQHQLAEAALAMRESFSS